LLELPLLEARLGTGGGQRGRTDCSEGGTLRAHELVRRAFGRYVSEEVAESLLRTPEALANIAHQLKPGARVAIAGIKFFPWWTGPLNLLAWLKNRPYNAKPGDLWHPWDRIEAYCQSPLRRWTTQFGMGYVAAGVIRKEST